MELALIDEVIERDKKGERVNRDDVRGYSDKKRDRLWEGGIEGRLGVQELKRAKIQQCRGGRRGEKSGQYEERRLGEGRGSSGSSSSAAKNNELKLNSREKRKAVRGEIGDEVGG